MGSIISLNYGKGLPAKVRSGNCYPVFGSNGIVGYHDDYLIEGPYLIVGRKGSIGEVNFSLSNCWPIDTTYFVSHSNELPIKYLYHFLKSLDLTQFDRASAIPGLNRNDAYNIEISLPPLDEQRRIVEKLDKLLANVDSAKARLERVPVILKRFRQAVLAAAVSGELTKDWREKNPGQCTAKLLEKVDEEREYKYKKVCEDAKSKGLRKPAPFKVNNESFENSNLTEIPDSWNWSRLVNVTNIQGGVTKGRKLDKFETVKLPYLRVANVQDGYLDLSEIKEIPIKVEEETKYVLHDGDILFIEGGDRDKLGRGTIWKNQIENCIHQNHIFRARPYSRKILSEYIKV